MPPLLLATGNRGKVEEYRRLLLGTGVGLTTPADIGLDVEVEESGATFLANAQLKARAYSAAAGLPCLADDSGLVVDALGGEPGVFSARYGGPGLDDTGRVRFLLDRMAGVGEREARFVCVICLAWPAGPARDVFTGQCEGRIGREPRGEGGFGYDPVFVFADGRTMAELPPGEKDILSHRGRAVTDMLRTVDLPGWLARAAVTSSRS